MEKYKRQEVSPVEEENERDESYKASNPNIDSSRTKFNYNIIYPDKSYIETINQRLSQLDLKRKIRSDAILMNSFVVTSDGEFFKGLRPWEQQDFFKDCVWFFENKYGKENMISAVVHLDETTPHLHLNFIPINAGRLSSKSLFDRQKLAQLQTELWEQVGKKYGLQRGKSGSAAAHISAAEHRAKKIVDEAEQRSAELNEQTEKKKVELADLTQTIESVIEATNQPIPKKQKDIEREIVALRTKNAMQEQDIKIRGRDQDDLFKHWQSEKRRADRNETSTSTLLTLQEFAPEELAYAKQIAEERKAQKRKQPSSPVKRNWWTK